MSTDPQQRLMTPPEKVADNVGLALLKVANDFGEGDQIAGNLYVLRNAVMAVVSPVLEQLLAERDALKAELAEIKRVIDPPNPGSSWDLPDDPAGAREAWGFLVRQFRWQFHMANKFGGQVGGLRAELAEARAAIHEVFDCWADLFGDWTAEQADAARAQKSQMLQRLVAALDASQRPEDTREETGRG